MRTQQIYRVILMSSNVAAAATRIIVMAIVLSLILLFLGIGVLVLIHVCIVARAFRGRFGNGRMVEGRSPGRTSMSMDDLDKLPCFHFQAREKGSSPVDCAVCLDSFKMGDRCRLLPLCNHSFHAQCVDSWLIKTPICPICRTSTDFGKGVQVSGEESSHGNQTAEGIQVRDAGIDTGDNPETVTGIQLSPNHSPSSSPAPAHPAA